MGQPADDLDDDANGASDTARVDIVDEDTFDESKRAARCAQQQRSCTDAWVRVQTEGSAIVVREGAALAAPVVLILWPSITPPDGLACRPARSRSRITR